MKNLGISEVADFGLKSDIFIGMKPTSELPNITIAEGQGVLPRGTMLAKNSTDGKYYIWDESKEDGTENLVGILGCEVDTTDADAKGFLYVNGEFNKVALFAGTTEVALGNFNLGNILIKEEHE
jgi:hypothetical protein